MAEAGDIIADLIRAGVPPELVSRAAVAIAEARAEGALTPLREARAQNAERQARWRDRHKPVTSNVSNVSNVTVKELAPRARAFSIGEEVDITPSVSTTHSPQGGRGARIPDGFSVSDAVRSFGQSQGLSDPQINYAFDEFVDYWRGVPGTRGRKLDWDGTLRNRLREIASRGGRSKLPAPRGRFSPDPQMNALAEAVEYYDRQS